MRQVGLFQRLGFECIRLLDGRTCRKRVPHHVQFGRGQQLGGVVALVEGVRLLDLRQQLSRHGCAGLVVLGVMLENRRVGGPMLIELRGKLDKVARG